MVKWSHQRACPAYLRRSGGVSTAPLMAAAVLGGRLQPPGCANGTTDIREFKAAARYGTLASAAIVLPVIAGALVIQPRVHCPARVGSTTPRTHLLPSQPRLLPYVVLRHGLSVRQFLFRAELRIWGNLRRLRRRMVIARMYERPQGGCGHAPVWLPLFTTDWRTSASSRCARWFTQTLGAGGGGGKARPFTSKPSQGAPISVDIGRQMRFRRESSRPWRGRPPLDVERSASRTASCEAGQAAPRGAITMNAHPVRVPDFRPFDRLARSCR